MHHPHPQYIGLICEYKDSVTIGNQLRQNMGGMDYHAGIIKPSPYPMACLNLRGTIHNTHDEGGK